MSLYVEPVPKEHLMPVERVKLSGSAVTGIEPMHYALACEVRGEPLPTEVALGCVIPKAQPPVLQLSKYLRVGYTLPPLPVDWAAKAMASINRVYLNSQYGCCVISDAYHRIGVWTANDSGTAVLGTDQEVLQTYRIWNPGNQDNGCQIDLVLNYCRDHGIPLNGVLHKIDGYVSIDWTNWDEVLIATYLFGALPLGFMLPQAWLNSAVWDVTNSPIAGGHDVPAVAVPDANGVTVASWGRLYRMTRAALTSRRWVMQMYAPLSPDWYGADGKAPNFLAVDDLRADLAKLAGGVIPDIGPTPQPPPGPTPVSNNRIHFTRNVPKGSWPIAVRGTQIGTLNVTDPLGKDKTYPLGTALASDDDPFNDDPFVVQESLVCDDDHPQLAANLAAAAPPMGASLIQYLMWIYQVIRQVPAPPKEAVLLAIDLLPIRDGWKGVLRAAVEAFYAEA